MQKWCQDAYFFIRDARQKRTIALIDLGIVMKFSEKKN